MKHKLTAVLMALCLLVSAGCSSANGSSASSDSGTASSGDTGSSASADVTTVSIGIGNGTTPFCYLDEDENIAGYDYEVLKAVGELLADKYVFEFKADDFSNLLIGLDTGTYDIAVNHFGYTAERAENYLYANEADFFTGPFHIGYAKGRTDISDFDSLAGKTVVTTAGSMAETLILNYKEAHPDLDLNVEYAEGQEVIHSGLVNGLYDAYVASEYDMNRFSSQYDNFLEYGDYEVPNDSDAKTGTFFVYSKGEEQLRDDIDEAIVSLREDGTLKEISESILGGDYTEPTE